MTIHGRHRWAYTKLENYNFFYYTFKLDEKRVRKFAYHTKMSINTHTHRRKKYKSSKSWFMTTHDYDRQLNIYKRNEQKHIFYSRFYFKNVKKLHFPQIIWIGFDFSSLWSWTIEIKMTENWRYKQENWRK